jgi:hypothetical protein
MQLGSAREALVRAASLRAAGRFDDFFLITSS